MTNKSTQFLEIKVIFKHKGLNKDLKSKKNSTDNKV